MIIKFYYYCIGFCFFGLTMIAQNKADKVLFKIDDIPYYVSDFQRVYTKNIDLVIDDEQRNLENYLDMYIVYKLKVLQAQKKGLDKAVAYVNELNTHKDELANNFIYDSQITEDLLQEAYDRYMIEVKASHILLSLDINASASDTLKVYNQAIAIRNKFLNGSDFEDLALEYSHDPSVKNNNGDLGYFSVFKMVYPFENSAYNTQVGQMSMPIRTNFGYHLMWITDKRSNRGQVSVRHILLTENVDNPDETKVKINEVYTRVLAGENFSELAKKYSADSYSARNGGLLAPFVAGDISVEIFEDQAFELQVPGQVSKPFKSSLGWHIVQLDYKKPPQSFENIKFYLEERIARDGRSKKIESAVIEKAKKKYPYKINKVNLDALIKAIDVNVYDQYWSLNKENPLNTKPLLIINTDKTLNVNDFVKFMTLRTNNSTNFNPISKFVNNTFNNFVDTELILYLKNNLESSDIEFKNLVQEYREGLLIFSLLEQEIWDQAKNDTIALQSFYSKYQQKYISSKQYDAQLFSTTDEKVSKKVHKLLKKGASIDEVKTKLNKNAQLLLVKSNIFNFDDPSLLSGIDESKIVNDIIKQDDNYYIVKINEILLPQQLSFEQVQSIVVNDYQKELEDTWGDRLKKEHTITIDQSVFNDLKLSLSKNQ
jgi:peptidyl-prolyl cis-trans isomerase SurA